ncbi:hypothetical protein ACO03V_08605 [Microbacterium sp. HMH0099]|uniref:hypothetical protein n=1 Tax=Microbacterium sp. HMH0099 TaxID=3414026 RepID=UPI003BF6ED19
MVVSAVAGCASGANIAPGSGDDAAASAQSSESPTVVAGDEAALAQAQAWLDAANVPPGAVRTDTSPGKFSSYTGWPCGPYEQLEGFWVVSGTTVVDAANWLIENPTADLVTTSFAPATEEQGPVDSAIVGYIPAPGAQEGIVYTLVKMEGDVAIRAEVAAQTNTATCPPLPDGSAYGAPGMG